MYEQILPWVGLGTVHPAAHRRRSETVLGGRGRRLAMLGLSRRVYLWFGQASTCRGVAVLADFPRLLSVLPDRGSPAFALCAACWVVAVLVPILAILDVTRQLAGRRLYRVRALTADTVEARLVMKPAPPVAAETVAEPVEVGVPILRPVERRTAAAAIASAGSHRAAH